jgi:hypothetical protein
VPAIEIAIGIQTIGELLSAQIEPLRASALGLPQTPSVTMADLLASWPSGRDSLRRGTEHPGGL